MFGKPKNDPAPEPEVVEDETLSNSQEGLPVPYLAGERKLALRWISRAYDVHAVEAKDRPSGKK